MKQKITPDIKTIQDQVKELNHPTTNDSTVLKMQQYKQNNNIIQSQNSFPQDYNPIRTNKSIFSCWKI